MKDEGFLNTISEIRWRETAYVLSRVYLAFAFVVGIVVPSVRKAIRAYETQGGGITTLCSVATIVPGFPLIYLTNYLEYPRPQWSAARILLLIGALALHYGWVAFWLTMWADYEARRQAKGENRK